MTPALLKHLRELAVSGEQVEFNLRVRAQVVDVSDAHGFCVCLVLERRDYGTKANVASDAREIDFRTVWVDDDEIIEVQV